MDDGLGQRSILVQRCMMVIEEGGAVPLVCIRCRILKYMVVSLLALTFA